MSRRVSAAIVAAASAFVLASCGSHRLVSLQITPSSITTSAGQTVQFHATGSYVLQSSRQRPASTQDITTNVTWSSSNAAVATIDSSGVAQVVGPGSTTITAATGNLSASAVLSAGGPGGTGTLGALTAIAVIPSSQTTQFLGEAAQYIAIGSISNGSGSDTMQDITNMVKWTSSDQSVATISPSGLAVSVGAGSGSATIVAMGTASNGTVVTGTATFSACFGCGSVTLPAISVFQVGLGTGRVQGHDSSNPSVIVIDCDPSAGLTAACTGYFPLNSTVVLTATPNANSTFGGWSANCTPAGTNACTVVMNRNQPIGAIFN